MASFEALPAGVMLAAGKIDWTDLFRDLIQDPIGFPFHHPWLIFGLSAQAVFAARFVVQWIASERSGRSVVPTAFWYLSLLGTTMLAIYAAHLEDPVFILGQTLNTFIYIRNLMLIHRPKVKAGGALPVVAAASDGGSRADGAGG